MTRLAATLRLALLSFVAVCLPRFIYAADWPLLDPAELALKQPAIDRTADAEALLWDVRVSDERDGSASFKTVFEHYLRIKVFNDRGRDQQSKVDLTYTDDARVRDVEARTVSPDGTIVELLRQDVFDRTVVEANGLKLKAKSFVLSSIVPGSIVEYRWREIHDDSLSQYLPLPFQRDIPVHVVRYHIKPFPLRNMGYEMYTQPFNIANIEVIPEKETNREGYTILQTKRMPAFTREPYMPPDLNLKSWILLYYASRDKGDRQPEKFWSDFGKEDVDYFKATWRVTGDIKTAATQAVGSATTLDDKIDALLKATRTRIKRVDLVSSLDALLANRTPNKTASDTLKRGAGGPEDVTLLFAAMAASIGLDVRLARLQDRSYAYSSAAMKQPYFFRHLAAAVRNGDRWLVIDVSNPHAPHGHVGWQREGMQALVMDAKASTLIDLPNSGSADSVRKRTAALTLLENGTLEGKVTVEYSGHLAAQRRGRDDDQSEEERRRSFTADLARNIPGLEIADFTIAGLDEPELPYAISFSLRAPGYAQRAGSRLLLQPEILERGAEAMFTAGQRWQQIDFRFAWSEQDHVTITLPPGYGPESLEAPPARSLDNGKTASYEVKISADGNRLTYDRRLSIGGDGRVLYGPESYRDIKGFMDGVHTGDGQSVALRRAGQ